jgi:hypothetical protein
MRRALLLVLLLATPAPALEWRGGRAEYWPEVLESRWEYRLDHAQIMGVIEFQRWRANEQALNQFGRVRPASPQPIAPGRPRQPGH